MKISTASILAIATILICLMAAMAACPPGSSCIDVYGGGSGEVIGDNNFVAETSYDDWQNDGIAATLTTGTLVLLKIPSGSQGSVKALMSRSGTSSASHVLNGDQYTMDANFSGSFKLGAEKSSNQGMASAEAKIFSSPACPNALKLRPVPSAMPGMGPHPRQAATTPRPRSDQATSPPMPAPLQPMMPLPQTDS